MEKQKSLNKIGHGIFLFFKNVYWPISKQFSNNLIIVIALVQQIVLQVQVLQPNLFYIAVNDIGAKKSTRSKLVFFQTELFKCTSRIQCTFKFDIVSTFFLLVALHEFCPNFKRVTFNNDVKVRGNFLY